MEMKRLAFIVLGIVLLAGAFFAGLWYGSRDSVSAAPEGGRKILYYVDPMNPSHTSDKPGLAPCGMKMEPVYEDQESATPATSAKVTGMVQLSQEKQQSIGVRIEQVKEQSYQHGLRLLGRVVADETRIYRINAAVGGWITEAPPYSTWSKVAKNDVLGAMYSPEFLPAAQALLYALDAKDRSDATENSANDRAGREALVVRSSARPARVSQFNLNIKQYVDSLRNLGMGELQVQEMIRTRKFTENFDIIAPASGFITRRNISQGQRFEKGAELFQIADLSRIWVLADLYENDAQDIKPGTPAKVSLPRQHRTFEARVSKTLPEFDAATRTLKIRLEMDNPGYALKPDMFVDVELPVSRDVQIVIPSTAVIDTGMRNIVYLARDEGIFEPRRIETGKRFDGLVEVLKGLSPGDRIVISGGFLIDSESRMNMSAAQNQIENSRTDNPGLQNNKLSESQDIDPVCGMTVDARNAEAAKRFSQYKGKRYFFCCDDCLKRFDAHPDFFLSAVKRN
jgi:Cu(I)/Ag(I) efflux system membrane fusion protein